MNLIICDPPKLGREPMFDVMTVYLMVHSQTAGLQVRKMVALAGLSVNVKLFYWPVLISTRQNLDEEEKSGYQNSKLTLFLSVRNY